MSTDGAWLYYKLCSGSRVDGLDFLIRGVVAEAVTDPRVEKWFFLRYLDQDGPHIRIRLKVPATEAKDADRLLHARFHDGTTALTTLPPADHMPLISVPAATAMHPGSFQARARRATYEPEYDIYGGPAGVAIAEDLFQVSSELALAMLDPALDAQNARKDLAPAFMAAVLDEFIARDGHAAFLERYVNHWLSASPELGYLKAMFHERGRELLDDGEQVLYPDASYADQGPALMRAWRHALADAHAGYRKLKGAYTPALVERVSFYFLHLMNNRLGFTALEEAYLAVLLLNIRRARSDAAEFA